MPNLNQQQVGRSCKRNAKLEKLQKLPNERPQSRTLTNFFRQAKCGLINRRERSALCVILSVYRFCTICVLIQYRICCTTGWEKATRRPNVVQCRPCLASSALRTRLADFDPNLSTLSIGLFQTPKHESWAREKSVSLFCDDKLISLTLFFL